MGEILHRYIFRETALTWLAVTGVLLLILMTDQFARVLDDAAGAKVPKEAIFAVLGLSSLRYLTILIPVGIFLSIMLAFARMYRDSEMAAMMACGIGNTALYRPVTLLAIGLAFLAGWLSIFASPAAILEIKTITDNAKRTADLRVLTPGRFTSIGNGDTVVYAEEVSEEGILTNVFVQHRDAGRFIVVKAERADQRNDLNTGNKVLTFYNGERYEGVPGEREYRITSFSEHGIPFEISAAREVKFRQETLSIEELLEENTPESRAELHWRVSVPLMLLVLTFIAVPLSRAPPRTGRYNRLVAGVMVYLIYSNLLGVGKIWIEQESVPSVFGLWWVHLLFVGFGAVLLMLQNRWFGRFFVRKSAVEAQA
jgi:lipopolysaccharide export system permease protein